MESIFSQIANSFTNNLIAEERYRMILEGMQVTLLITLCSAVLGTLLGGLVCRARMSRHAWLQGIAKIYIDLMRGTPVLVFLMLMYYVFMAPLSTTGVVVAIVTFALNTSAYIGEMLRSGIEGIDKGQREAGLALGYTQREVFLRIILPQVVRKIMPVYLGEVISLLKGTSIVGYIAVVDMTRASDLIRSRTFDAFFPLIVTAAIYFLAAWFIGMLLNSLVEKRRTRAIIASLMLALMGVSGSIPMLINRTTSVDTGTTVQIPPIFNNLNGKRVGVIIGSIQDMVVTQYAPEADIQRYSNLTDIIAALQNNKVDIICQENITVAMNPEIAEVVDTIDAGLPPTPLAACFALGDTILQQDFNHFLRQIKTNGTYQEICDRWLTNGDISRVPNPRQTGTGKTIKVATFPVSPPYNFVKMGEVAGFEIDLLIHWANQRNYQMEFTLMDFSSQIPAVQTGKADVALGMIAVTEERQKKVLFSDGYYESRMMFNTRKGELALLTGDNNGTTAETEKNATAKWWLTALLLVIVAGGVWLLVRRRKISTVGPKDGLHATKEDDPIICVSHLSKRFGELEVLRDIDFEVHKGEVISLIGPSGTGKSTLLRALNMLEPPTSGDIRVNGELITVKGYPLHKMRQKIGMVFQSFNLFDHMTVLENITDAPIHLLHIPEAQAKEEAIALLKKVGLAQKADVYPSALSGGQKQRVAIARALAMHPEVILFDEPTSALDPTMVGEVLSVIRQLAKSGLTMLIVTHEMRFAQDVSSRIFFMNEGRIYEDGTPEQIFNQPVHSATKAFVQRIQKLVYEIDSDDFDYLQIHTGINRFCIKYNLHINEQAYALVKEVLFTHMRSIRPLTLRMTHAELSGVTALDFMVEHWDRSPLNDAAREALQKQVKQLIEEPTSRGFRVKLIL